MATPLSSKGKIFPFLNPLHDRMSPLPSRERVRVRALFIFLIALVAITFSLARPILAAPSPDLEDRTRAIANELRCVVCQNLSVADSPSEMAQQMRGIIREQLEAGKSPQEIKNYFVSKY